jgi:hypothetical protein
LSNNFCTLLSRGKTKSGLFNHDTLSSNYNLESLAKTYANPYPGSFDIFSGVPLYPALPEIPELEEEVITHIIEHPEEDEAAPAPVEPEDDELGPWPVTESSDDEGPTVSGL